MTMFKSLRSRLLLLVLLLQVSGFILPPSLPAQFVTNPEPAAFSVLVDTNGILVSPPTFFAANGVVATGGVYYARQTDFAALTNSLGPVAGNLGTASTNATGDFASATQGVAGASAWLLSTNLEAILAGLTNGAIIDLGLVGSVSSDGNLGQLNSGYNVGIRSNQLAGSRNSGFNGFSGYYASLQLADGVGAHNDGCLDTSAQSGNQTASGKGAHNDGYLGNAAFMLASGNGAGNDGFVYSGSDQATGDGSRNEGKCYHGNRVASGDGSRNEGYANCLPAYLTMQTASGLGSHNDGYVTFGGYQIASGNGSANDGYLASATDVQIASGKGSHNWGRNNSNAFDFAYCFGDNVNAGTTNAVFANAFYGNYYGNSFATNAHAETAFAWGNWATNGLAYTNQFTGAGTTGFVGAASSATANQYLNGAGAFVTPSATPTVEYVPFQDVPNTGAWAIHWYPPRLENMSVSYLDVMVDTYNVTVQMITNSTASWSSYGTNTAAVLVGSGLPGPSYLRVTNFVSTNIPAGTWYGIVTLGVDSHVSNMSGGFRFTH